MEDQIPSLAAIGGIGAAFVAMLRLLSRPESRWASIVNQLEKDVAARDAIIELRDLEIADLEDRLRNCLNGEG